MNAQVHPDDLLAAAMMATAIAERARVRARDGNNPGGMVQNKRPGPKPMPTRLTDAGIRAREALAADPNLTATQLAAAVGMSESGARHVIRTVVGSDGRPGPKPGTKKPPSLEWRMAERLLREGKTAVEVRKATGLSKAHVCRVAATIRAEGGAFSRVAAPGRRMTPAGKEAARLLAAGFGRAEVRRRTGMSDSGVRHVQANLAQMTGNSADARGEG